MNEHRTSIAEASQMIQDSVEKSRNNIEIRIADEGQYKNILTFEKLLSDIISHKWMMAFPKSYLKCYVTDESYHMLNNAGYTWDMCIINKGNFNELIRLNHCADMDVYDLIKEYSITKEEARKTVIERRKTLAKTIYEETNIGIWVINNLLLNT